MPYRGWFSGPGGVVILCIFLVACQGYASPDPYTEPDTLNIATYSGLSVANPLLGVSGVSSHLWNLVYDGLIRFDARMEAVPHLASSWRISDDGRRWVFFLRSGVRFHDGMELTAEDVVFTYDLIRKKGRSGLYGSGLREVEQVTAGGRYRVEILLRKPSPAFLYHLDAPILPRHFWEGEDLKDSQLNRRPVGTGPYRLAVWKKDGVRLEANRSYFLGPPPVKAIWMRSYPSQEGAWAGLITGEADFFWMTNPKGFQIMEQVHHIKVYRVPKPYVYMVAFNLTSPMFSVRRVRQALNYAVDKEVLVQEVLNGMGRVASGLVFTGSWAYKRDLAPYPYDPRKAMALLREAGWKERDQDHLIEKDGKVFTFTLYTNQGDDIKNRAALLIQQNLWDLGIRMKVVAVSASSTEFLFRKHFDAVFLDLQTTVDP
ncbi:MAG: hypothetical protein HY760_01640, partial [Nitrospirae bacterium]|nr:hypothetical protein [Nitrospirota bacterium]